MTYRILAVFGTRPEAIKMAPLVKKLQQEGAFSIQVCVTGQHRQLLDPVLQLFDLQPDFDLNIMKSGQDLIDLTSRIMLGMREILAVYKPDLVLVHGDTTTAFATSLVCYYQKISIAHIEAGLRTGNLFAPYPEEANRHLTSVLADYHFVPTEIAKANLLAENHCAERIWVTGNTVIDALMCMLQKIEHNLPLVNQFERQFAFLEEHKKLILVTGHRRENFGEGIEQICQALRTLAEQHPSIQIVYPVHLNPNVIEPVNRFLMNVNNVFLLDPQEYLPFIYLMKKAYVILTDSGGIQEEASALNKPVLLMREMTERPEAILTGSVKLVGTDKERIIQGVSELLNNPQQYQQMSEAQNPYGDGKASERITEVIKQLAKGKST